MLKARLAPSSVSDARSGVGVAAQPEPRGSRVRGEAERAALKPAAHQPLDRPSRGLRGARGAGQSVLKMLTGIAPILPSSRAFMAPAMSVTSPSADTSAPPARTWNWLSTTRPRSGEAKPARRPVVDLQPLQERRLGAEPAACRLELEGPAGPVGALLRVDDAAGELHAAVAPHEHRGGDVEPARGPAVGQREMAAVDAQRRRRQPWQQHLPGRGVDADGAAQDLAGVGEVEAGIAPHRHVEAFQARQRRQRPRHAARHEALDGDGELQGRRGSRARGCGS